jgi:hypothetical protein
LLRNAQKYDKKNRTKQPRVKKNLAFFVMSPDGFFREKVFFVVLNSPCYETPQKRLKKNRLKNKKVSNYFCFGAAANVRHFRHFFFTAPLVLRNGPGEGV